MKTHPAADLFPLLTGDDFEALKADIKAHGQRDPVVILDGAILDGRNRWRACEAIGVTPRTVPWDGEGSPTAYVLSVNLCRRHLTPTQKSFVAEAAEPLFAAEAKERQRKGREKVPHPEDTGKARDKAAATVGVNPHYVSDAKRISAKAPEVAALAKGGAVNMQEAKLLAELSPARRKDAVAAVSSGTKPREAVRQAKKAELAARSIAEPSGRYRVIYADPPWEYGDTRAGLSGYEATAAADHYPTMPTRDICALPVREWIDDDAVLFCWATFPMLPDALEVVRAWGFRYKTAFVWAKGRGGMGNYHDVSCELLLLATRGSCTPDADKRESQLQQVKRAGRHSEKPDAFREMIDRLYKHGRRLELFRRGAAPKGWDVWGNEATSPQS
jgi:N6-adenosine-specific RNA methylase IME4